MTAIASGRHPATITTGECCQPDYPAVKAHTPTSHAVELMADHGLQRLPVVDDHGHLIGTIWLSDLPAIDRS